MFIATGNNIILGGDLPRRCYWIRLDAQQSEPWRNRHFRHPDLRGWVQESRGRLLGAILTLARAWFLAGSPLPSTAILGSFEEWCRGSSESILEFAGITGFLGNLDELYRQSDPTLAAREAFLIELFRWKAKSGFTVAQAVTGVKQDAKREAAGIPLPEGPRWNLEANGSFTRRLGLKLSSSASGDATEILESTWSGWTRSREPLSGVFGLTVRTSSCEYGEFGEFLPPYVREMECK